VCRVFRIESLGLQDIARVVEHDVTVPELVSKLSGEGSVDVVTMSYSYSMIPDQKATMKNILKLLKPGGYVCIADFFLRGNYDDCLSPLFRTLRGIEASMHKAWFAMDHVHLLEEEQIDTVNDQLAVVWDNRFRGAIPFLPFFQPFHGVYILEKK
jgi:S-adenosylmethionine-diacylgycerolhomoserine-N-methlytransferase